MFDVRMRTRALAVVALALLAGACGGVESEPNLAAKSERTEAAGSSAFSLHVVQSVGERSQELQCEGAADYAGKRMHLVCGGDWEVVAIGDGCFVRGASPVFGFPPDRPWVRVPIGDGDDSPHELNPATLLAKLRAASATIQRVGKEEVRDLSTVRYRMTVRCEEAGLECPGETTPPAIQQRASSASSTWMQAVGRRRR